MPICSLYDRARERKGGDRRRCKLVTQRHEGWGPLLRAIDGHTSEVLSVGFSPDGKRVVSGSNDSTVRIWDVGTGQPTATLEGHTEAVNSVGFSPDGKRVVSISDDKTVRIWDVGTGQPTATLEGHTLPVRSVGFSPDGKRVVSGSWDSTVRIWDVGTGQPTATLEGHTSLVLSVGFSPDGTRISSRDFRGVTRTWNAGEHFQLTNDSLEPTSHTSSQPPSPSFSFDDRSGWLSIPVAFADQPRRLCWVPVDRRPRGDTISSFGRIVVLGSGSGIVTVLSFVFS
jgi:WD40 repeat protein